MASSRHLQSWRHCGRATWSWSTMSWRRRACARSSTSLTSRIGGRPRSAGGNRRERSTWRQPWSAQREHERSLVRRRASQPQPLTACSGGRTDICPPAVGIFGNPNRNRSPNARTRTSRTRIVTSCDLRESDLAQSRTLFCWAPDLSCPCSIYLRLAHYFCSTGRVPHYFWSKVGQYVSFVTCR